MVDCAWEAHPLLQKQFDRFVVSSTRSRPSSTNGGTRISASNMLFSAGNGIGPRCLKSGFATFPDGFKCSSAFSSGPACTDDAAHLLEVRPLKWLPAERSAGEEPYSSARLRAEVRDYHLMLPCPVDGPQRHASVDRIDGIARNRTRSRHRNCRRPREWPRRDPRSRADRR